MPKAIQFRAYLASSVIAAGFFGDSWSGPRRAFAIDLFNIQPAALDQPQINAIVFVGNNALPQIGHTEDPFTGEPVSLFNIQSYLDTGASGILLSSPTATLLNIPTESVNGTPVIYSDVGVVGTDDFQVSQQVRLALASFYNRTDLDQFSDANQTVPIITPYTPVPPPNTSVRVQVGPYRPIVETPGVDEIDQLIALLTAEENAVDVVGMPVLKGRVMVMDPTGVKALGDLFGVLGDILNGGGGDLTDEQFAALLTAGMRTHIYSPGTPYHPSTLDTDPGIPKAQLHIKLSYGSFDRFTKVTLGVGGPTQPGLPAPTLEHNPFIGKDPVKILDGTPQPNTPGIKISFTSAAGALSSEGNWLLDTGAAASIISRAQAATVGVNYSSNSYGTDTPVLVDQNNSPLPDQFTLVLGGIGGQTTLAGFYLDSLLLRTQEGSAIDDDNPYNVRFTGAPVLVGDITVKDPQTGQTITLDGIFGMNFLIQSINILTDDQGQLLDIGQPSPSFIRWATFDEPNGILGLTIDQTADALPANWDGTNGSWSDISKWTSNPDYPHNAPATFSGYEVSIGSGAVTLNVSATIDTLLLTGGTLTGSAAMNLTMTGGTITGTGVYNVLGTTTLTGETLFLGPGGGAHHAGAITGQGAVIVDTGAQLTSKGITVNELTVNGTAVIQAGSGSAGTSRLNALTIAHSGTSYSGKLDLTDNKLIIQATDSADKAAKIADLNAAITSGSNGATWTGNGITSSTAQGTNAAHYGVGVFDNAVLNKTSFGGQPTDTNSVFVTIAHLGDANGNGIVDIQDVSILANNWQQSRNNWTKGDLNRDGIVNIQDFSIVANNWQQSSSFGQAAESLGFAALIGGAGGAGGVPEPATVGVLGVAAGMMLMGRRRAKVREQK